MKHFLINTITNWDEPPRARHQIAQTLSKKNDVSFVSANKTGWPKIKKSKEDTNLCLLTPYFPISYKIRYRLPIINEIYHRWLFNNLHKEYKDHTVLNFDYTARLIFTYFDKVVYYCNDNFMAISKRLNPGFIANYHKRCEKYIAKKAQFCVVTTSIFKANLEKYNKHVYEIKLGGPSLRDTGITLKIPAKKTNSINVGLVGYIRLYNLSYRLINHLSAHKDIYLTFVGPVDKSFLQKLHHPDKIKLRGVLTGKDLYEEVNNFDVAIAPYNKDKMKEGGTPNKLWIYFALGKPIVVSDLVALKNLRFPEKSLYVSKNEEEFLNLTLKAYEENSPELAKKRKVFADENSWDSRMEQFLELHNTYFKTEE